MEAAARPTYGEGAKCYAIGFSLRAAAVAKAPIAEPSPAEWAVEKSVERAVAMPPIILTPEGVVMGVPKARAALAASEIGDHRGARTVSRAIMELTALAEGAGTVVSIEAVPMMEVLAPAEAAVTTEAVGAVAATPRLRAFTVSPAAEVVVGRRMLSQAQVAQKCGAAGKPQPETV